MAIGFKDLSNEKREAVIDIISKYRKNLEEEPVTDSDVDTWTNWATTDDLNKKLEELSRYYKNTGNKSVYLEGMDILKLFHPEIDTPLFKLMREID